MDAMHCLRMPHGPPGGPDRPVLSHSSRRNPLLRRHLAFPKGGARLAATRRWTVCAQAPAPSQPEGEDANPKGRLGGWHRTRGAAVGAAVVLACALGTAFLSRGRGACCCPHGQIAALQTPPMTEGDGSLPQSQTDTFAKVLLDIFKRRAGAPKEPPKLLHHVAERIRDDVQVLGRLPKTARPLRLLAEHLADELAEQDYCCLKASRREQETTDLLYAEWSELGHGDPKDNLGFLLMEIFINQGDYQRAQTICEDELKAASEKDARPRLFLAIIKMMLAVEKMLETKKHPEVVEMIKEATDAWNDFRRIYKDVGEEPKVSNDKRTQGKIT
ncbi:hypothetical protein COCNU_02G002680 [Cocos nucifera]|uniref:Uncharacterized protein n=1 Tax=Cocos nucifera TaxID=13894 RepID=A0A8K0HXH9_COCNU|nr:hypothetical protein COCNU_02G002680 [Cocos nucifera]